MVGAGKSTQIRLLANALRCQNLSVQVSFIKTGHVFAYLLEYFLVKLLVRERSDLYLVGALIEARPGLFKRLFKLWLTLDIFSISIRFLLTVYIPIKRHRIVIVEEYLYASIADYIYIVKKLGLSLKTLYPAANFLLRLFKLSGNVQTIFLNANNVELAKRWDKRFSLKEKIEYLQMQHYVLLPLSMLSPSFLYLETDKRNISATHEYIMHYLFVQN